MRKNPFRLQKRLSLALCFAFPATAAYVNDKHREAAVSPVSQSVIRTQAVEQAAKPMPQQVAAVDR